MTVYTSDACMFTRDVNNYEQLYKLDVLGVEDRGENDQLQVLNDFGESITRQEDGRYQVSIPWIPGSKLTSTNEQHSRTRLRNVNKKLAKDKDLKQEYKRIVEDHLDNRERPGDADRRKGILHATQANR